MFIHRLLLTTNRGLYTVEGAFTIVIFTALFMMLLSIIPIIRTESVVQAAINQTAMEVSEYSYAVCSATVVNENTDSLKAILSSVEREAKGFTTGSIICKELTENRIDEKTLKNIDDGYDGLNFSYSNILGDGETISVIVIYKINVETFGFVDKTLTICQKAQTKAWLPYDAEILDATDTDSSSIWSQTNFVRGKYFLEKIKDENKAINVKSGQGIDLYNEETGKVTEIFSLNIFESSYSYNADDLNVADNYSPNTDNLEKQIYSYVSDFESDISKCGQTIEMADGSTKNLNVNSKEIIIVLPKEAKENKNFVSFFRIIKTEIKFYRDITLKYVYMEEAL